MPRSRSTLGHMALTKSLCVICDGLYTVVPSHSDASHSAAEIQWIESGSWAVVAPASGLDWKVLQSAWSGVYWTSSGKVEGDGAGEGESDGDGEGEGAGEGESDGDGKGEGEGELHEPKPLHAEP